MKYSAVVYIVFPATFHIAENQLLLGQCKCWRKYFHFGLRSSSIGTVKKYKYSFVTWLVGYKKFLQTFSHFFNRFSSSARGLDGPEGWA